MDKSINEMIKAMVAKAGSIYNFANICEASPKTVRKWLNGANPDAIHLLNAMNYFNLLDVNKIKDLSD